VPRLTISADRLDAGHGVQAQLQRGERGGHLARRRGFDARFQAVIQQYAIEYE
jgi:hypothetical protein